MTLGERRGAWSGRSRVGAACPSHRPSPPPWSDDEIAAPRRRRRSASRADDAPARPRTTTTRKQPSPRARILDRLAASAPWFRDATLSFLFVSRGVGHFSMNCSRTLNVKVFASSCSSGGRGSDPALAPAPSAPIASAAGAAAVGVVPSAAGAGRWGWSWKRSSDSLPGIACDDDERERVAGVGRGASRGDADQTDRGEPSSARGKDDPTTARSIESSHHRRGERRGLAASARSPRET
jgi:hypothetical protein